MSKISTLPPEDYYSIAKRNLKAYGSYVLGNRAIPDGRDGLIPVQRALLLSCGDLGLSHRSGYVKSARVTGHAMGRYHPHGDSYGTLVKMTQEVMVEPLIEGKGNFGSWDSGAAASRYTEVRMTELGHSLLNPIGLSVVDHTPNYDDTTTMAVVLPAVEPLLLYNGALGIAYGTIVGVPSFERKGVLHLASEIIGGNEITVKDLLKHLKINTRYGGVNVTPKDRWRQALSEGRGSMQIGADIRDEPNKLVLVGIPPHFDIEKFSEKVSELPEVSMVANESSKSIRIVVYLKRSAHVTEKLREKISSLATSRINLALNVVTRRAVNGDTESKFASLTFIQYLERWCKYRLALEGRMIGRKLELNQQAIDRHDLLLLVIKHLDALVKLIRKKHESRAHLEKAVGKLLDINAEEVKTVLALTISRLSSLETAEVEADKKKLIQTRKVLTAQSKDLPGTVLESWSK